MPRAMCWFMINQTNARLARDTPPSRLGGLSSGPDRRLYALVPRLLLGSGEHLRPALGDFGHCRWDPLFESGHQPATASSMAQADGCFWSAALSNELHMNGRPASGCAAELPIAGLTSTGTRFRSYPPVRRRAVPATTRFADVITRVRPDGFSGNVHPEQMSSGGVHPRDFIRRRTGTICWRQPYQGRPSGLLAA